MPKKRIKDDDDFVVDDDLDLDRELESEEFIVDDDEEFEEDSKTMKKHVKAKSPAKRGAKRSAGEG